MNATMMQTGTSSCPQCRRAQANIVSFQTPFRTGTRLHTQSLQRQNQARRFTLKVQSALSRAGKEEAVAKLKAAFDESTAVFGVRFNKISVKDMSDFRRSLPEDGSKFYVVKNTLLKLASDESEGWAGLGNDLKGENAWVFAKEESVGACVKAFLEFEKNLKGRLPKEERAKAKPTDISVGMLESQLLNYQQVLQLEKLPTKTELIRDLAVMIHKVPTRLAVTIKAVPTKLARAINLLAEGDENKDLLVGDVFPKASGSS